MMLTDLSVIAGAYVYRHFAKVWVPYATTISQLKALNLGRVPSLPSLKYLKSGRNPLM